ncbi:MAG: hypothetical protein J6P03_00645, partial [Opitutales bacterium]|nr:hypothetical protein [Opitutales bacterium]
NMGGMSLDKMEIEIPPMEIFGTKASSDRVFIAFEATKTTMTEEMGGLDAYNVVKGEMKKLVNSLPSTILSNIMAYNIWNCHLFETCFPSLMPATAANKATFETWINRINNDPLHPANLKPNLRVKEENIPPYANEHKYRYPGCGGMEHSILGRYEIYQAALESHAGAVWILTLDWPLADEYIMPYLKTEEEIKKYNDTWKSNIEKAKEKGEFDENGWAKWQEACKPACEKARQWLIAENKRRAAKGIPQMVEDNMLAVADRLKIPHPPAPRHPDYYLPVNLLPKKKVYTKQSLYAAYEPLLKKNYDQNKLPRPTVNIILLMRRDGKFAFGLDGNSKKGKKKIAEARSWAKMNGKGTARILRAAKPVSEFEDK